jgi:lipopolysaccharide export system permease protein
MLNLEQLYDEIDTIKIQNIRLVESLNTSIIPYQNFKKFRTDTSKVNVPAFAASSAIELLKDFDRDTKLQVMERAMNRARNIKNFADVTAKQLEYKEHDFTVHMIEVYRKFTLSIACLVLFFIGAPLGSIIRKGGLGWPLFYCVLFFIFYHVSSIIGEKLAENNVLTAFGGMWLSTLILTPIGMFLTLKAANDSKLFSADYYRKTMVGLFKSKSQA